MMSLIKKRFSGDAPDDSGFIRLRHRLWTDLVAIVGGGFYAAALPPLNLYLLAFIAPAILLFVLERDRAGRGFWHGWLWGMGWALPSYSFLREIEMPVPLGVAAAVSFFCGVFALVWVSVRDEVLFPFAIYSSGSPEKESYLKKGVGWGRQILLTLLAAALFTVIEWSRSRLFPWNDLAVTQYRNLIFVQIAALTGSYGVTFAVFCLGAGIYTLWRFRCGYRGLAAGAVIALLICGYGVNRINRKLPPNTQKIKMILVQGDLSQRRHPLPGATEEALNVYSSLTAKALDLYPDADLVVWPECAVPIAFASSIDVRKYRVSRNVWSDYQFAVRSCPKPLLIGALDYAPGFSLEHPADNKLTNSALYFDGKGTLAGRYDKCHRVPFGEYIPFRRFLPEAVINLIDMGRDLHPGSIHDPLRIVKDINAGMMICFESVFGYIARESVRCGADFLLVLSNDAWYPKSCEPEQHLANASLRAIESGVPMVRCGNNGGTLVVAPTGKITQVLTVEGKEERPELRRGRGIGVVELSLPEKAKETLFVRWGDYFPLLLLVAAIASIYNKIIVSQRYKDKLCRLKSKK